MRMRPLAIAVLSVVSSTAEPVTPSELYIVSQFFSDNGPAVYHRVLEIMPDGDGVAVRYTRVAPVSLQCPGSTVQSVETRLARRSIKDLLERTGNPCLVNEQRLKRSIRRYSRTNGGFETISFGVVANCGRSPVILTLPVMFGTDLDRLTEAHPDFGRLWQLADWISKAAFGESDVFHNAIESELLRLSESAAAALRSGKFDAGLAAATGRKTDSFRDVLADYKGPISSQEIERRMIPQLIGANPSAFEHYRAPVYPPLAKQARVEGKVELQIAVNAAGDVVDTTAVSGHALLKRSAVDAAKQWKFKPGAAATGPLNFTVDFAFRCP